MMYDSIEFKTMASLTDEEKQILLRLLPQPKYGRKLFRQWLKCLNPLGMYATLVRHNNKIIAMAAVSTHEGWNLGIIGVFVKPDYREKGIACLSLDNLLMNVSNLDNKEDQPRYLHYNPGLERLFRPAIEHHGFKDLYTHQEEYSKLESEMEKPLVVAIL